MFKWFFKWLESFWWNSGWCRSCGNLFNPMLVEVHQLVASYETGRVVVNNRIGRTRWTCQCKHPVEFSHHHEGMDYHLMIRNASDHIFMK